MEVEERNGWRERRSEGEGEGRKGEEEREGGREGGRKREKGKRKERKKILVHFRAASHFLKLHGDPGEDISRGKKTFHVAAASGARPGYVHAPPNGAGTRGPQRGRWSNPPTTRG